MELLDDLADEIDKLSGAVYRKEQKIWAKPKQLRNINRRYSKARGMKPEEVLKLKVAVEEVAPPTARVTRLTAELYAEAIK